MAKEIAKSCNAKEQWSTIANLYVDMPDYISQGKDLLLLCQPTTQITKQERNSK